MPELNSDVLFNEKYYPDCDAFMRRSAIHKKDCTPELHLKCTIHSLKSQEKCLAMESKVRYIVYLN